MIQFPPVTPAGTGRLIRAQKLLTEAVAAVASYHNNGSADSSDVDLRQAIYAIDRAKQIIGKRIDKDTPR